MNAQEYIASGILEEYIIGSVSDQERREVECMSKIYPDIGEALNELSAVMEKYARKHQIAPPAHLKDQIMAQMTFAKEENEVLDNVKPLQSANNQSLWRPLRIAASVALVAGCGYLYLQNQNIKAELADSKTTGQSQQQLLAMYQNTDVKTVIMNGTPKYTDAKATVFWNPKNAEVNMLVQNLPKIDKNHQYQLWVIASGKPVDMGVFDATTAVLKMNSTQLGEAFAVTIEKRGGSPTPTMDEMCVVGKI